MEKIKVFKEFPKGGALGKSSKGVVFIKNYWSENLPFIFAETSDIKKGDKGYFIENWLKSEPISAKEFFSLFKKDKEIVEYDLVNPYSKENKELIKRKEETFSLINKDSLHDFNGDYRAKEKLQEDLKKFLNVEDISLILGSDNGYIIVRNNLDIPNKVKEAFFKTLDKIESIRKKLEEMPLQYSEAVNLPKLERVLSEGGSIEEAVNKAEKVLEEATKKSQELVKNFAKAVETDGLTW